MGIAKQAQHFVDGCIYAALWPAAQLLQRRLYPPPQPEHIALTFDDGPNPQCTPHLLDLLAVHQVKAAFFLLGQFAQAHPALVRRMVSEGHVVGNHTWSHPNLVEVSIPRVRQELQRTSAVLKEITGKTTRLFRPPYGACNARVLNEARAMGLTPVLWNAITADWEERPAAQIVAELGEQIERNRGRRRATYLVLHDGNASNPDADCRRSVEAAVQLITKLNGSYRFVSLQPW